MKSLSCVKYRVLPHAPRRRWKPLQLVFPHICSAVFVKAPAVSLSVFFFESHNINGVRFKRLSNLPLVNPNCVTHTHKVKELKAFSSFKFQEVQISLVALLARTNERFFPLRDFSLFRAMTFLMRAKEEYKKTLLYRENGSVFVREFYTFSSFLYVYTMASFIVLL